MSGRCLAETCANWTGHGCACAVMDVEPPCVPCLMGEPCSDHDPAGDTTAEKRPVTAAQTPERAPTEQEGGPSNERYPDRTAPELAAVSQELGLYDEPAREIPAGEGHTWEIRIRERGSYGVAGEPGRHDAADWSELRTQTVRAWSLTAALDTARALPITAWFDEEEDASGSRLSLGESLALIQERYSEAIAALGEGHEQPAPAGDDELRAADRLRSASAERGPGDAGGGWVRVVLADDLRAVLAGYDERGSERVAARAEVERLLEVNGDLMTESRQLQDLASAAKAVVRLWDSLPAEVVDRIGREDFVMELDVLAALVGAHEQGRRVR